MNAKRIEEICEMFEADADACRARRELLAARARIKRLTVALEAIAGYITTPDHVRAVAMLALQQAGP